RPGGDLHLGPFEEHPARDRCRRPEGSQGDRVHRRRRWRHGGALRDLLPRAFLRNATHPGRPRVHRPPAVRDDRKRDVSASMSAAPREAIVLAGGLGTRLRQVVADVPKPMAPVAGRPFLAWVLDHLRENATDRVILAAGYMAQTLRDHLGDHWRGIELCYSIESEPLGTGGAVR